MSRGSSLGGEGQSSYFNTVTGTNDYERQSWRDSYNGGYAAGDFTGNVNASLADQRDNFQGATWSGSSTQPSALQLAQSMGGVGSPAISNGPQSSLSSGPGNAVVVSAPRKSSGGTLTLAGGKGPLNPTIKDVATGGWAGLKVEPNPWFSDVENWWEPRYGEPGEWLGGIVNIGADIPFNASRAVGLNTDKLFADLANAPGRVWAGSNYDSDKIARTPDGNHWSPFWEVNASARRGSDGVYKTGGGF